MLPIFRARATRIAISVRVSPHARTGGEEPPQTTFFFEVQRMQPSGARVRDERLFGKRSTFQRIADAPDRHTARLRFRNPPLQR